MRCFLLVLLLGVCVSSTRAQEPDHDDARGDAYLTLNAAGHIGPVNGLAFAPGGHRLYSVGADKTVQVWNPHNGQRVRVLRMPVGLDDTGALTGAVLSPDSKTLALRLRQIHNVKTHKNVHGTVALLNVDDGRIRWLDAKLPSPESGVAFSADGDRLVAGRFVWFGLAKVWDLKPEQAEALEPVELPNTMTGYRPAFAPDGRLLYARPDATSTYVWDVNAARKARMAGKEPQPLVELKGHKKFVSAVGWDRLGPDGSGRAITADLEGIVRVWNKAGVAVDQYQLRDLGGDLGKQPGFIVATSILAISRDEIAVAGRVDQNNWTAVVNLADHSRSRLRLFSPDQALGKVPVAAITLDGETAACSFGPAQNEIALWKTGSGKVLRRLGGGVQTPLNVYWSTKGQTLCWEVPTGAGSVRRGPFTLDLKELHLWEVIPEERNDRKSFHGRLLKDGSWTVEEYENTSRDPHWWYLRIAKDGKVVSTTDALERRPPMFTLVPGETPHVAWSTGGDLFLSGAADGKKIHHMIPGRQQVQSLAPSPDGHYFATTTDSQVIHVHSTKYRAPLLSIFQAGDDWVVWTRLGYYASSAGGERLLGWTVNNGYDELATFHPASRFRSTFHRPDVIRLALDEGNAERALKTADRVLPNKKATAGKAADPNESLPPTVRMEVADQTKMPVQVTVKATAEAKAKGQPLASLQLLLDGRPAPVEKDTVKFDTPLPPGKPLTQSWVIKLPPGKHQLTVLARGKDSFAGSEPIEVEGPTVRGNAVGRLHFACFGVSRYKNDGKGANDNLNLKYAARDAMEVFETLSEITRAGTLYESGRALARTNHLATAQDILDALDSLSKDTSIKSSDLAVIYFSGHGEKDDEGKLWLLTHETDRDDLKKTCLSAEKLKEALAQIPCKVLLLLDACHSTAVGPKRKIGSATDDLTRTLIDEDCAVAVMTAAMGKEFALEGMKDEKGQLIENGLFTRALKEALAGAAEADEDGLVFVHNVYQHVFKRVRLWSLRKQNPFLALPWSVKPFAVVRQATASPGESK